MESIKKLIIQSALIVAPMVRISTLPFRILCANHGADIIYTEEIIAKKLMGSERKYNKDLDCYDYINFKDNALVMRISPKEKDYLILQLGASTPEDAVKAAKIAENDIRGIDLNMGCPKHFSTHGNMGSALLAMPNQAKAILDALVKEFPNKSISCKVRLMKEDSVLKELIETIQSANINYFGIHLRYKDQTSKDKAYWKEVFKVKEYAQIPFVVNGDLFTPRDIQLMRDTKTCDAFMLGRGAIHNPNVFNEYKNTIEDIEVCSFNLNDKETLFNNDVRIIQLNEEVKDKDSLKQNAMNASLDESNIELSTKLAKALEKKYNHKKIDIMPIVKELFEIALKYGNNYGNTKYVMLYILKTHRHLSDVFKQIQNSRNYEGIALILNMREVYEKYLSSSPNMKYYYDNSLYQNKSNKNKKDSFA